MRKIIFQILVVIVSMFTGAVAFSVFLQLDKDFRDMAFSYYEAGDNSTFLE